MRGTKEQSNKGHKGYRVRKASFEDLWIWRESHELMLEMHSILNKLPHSEYRLTDQRKRSSGSVLDNIAEGYGSFYLYALCFFVTMSLSLYGLYTLCPTVPMFPNSY